MFSNKKIVFFLSLAATVVLWFLTFKLHPVSRLDIEDIIIEGAILLFSILAYFNIARLRISHLTLGWYLAALSQLINFLDEFTSEPGFFNTTLEGVILAIGLALIVKGFSKAYWNLQKENELQKNLRRELILTFNASPVGLIKIDDKFRIEYINPAMRKILGLREGEEPITLGKDIREIPSVKALGLDDLFRYRGENETVSLETPFRSLYGRECYISVAANPLFDRDQFLGAVIVVTDITERKKNEQRILHLEGIQHCIVEVLQTIVVEKDRKELLQRVCKILTQSRGYIFAWIGGLVEDRRRVIPVAWPDGKTGTWEL